MAEGMCPYCKEEKSNLWDHKQRCKKRPGIAPKPATHPRQPAQPAEIVSEAPSPPPGPVDPPATGQRDGKANGCDGCPGRHLHGLNVAEVAVVELAVRSGLGIDQAAELVQAAQAAGR